MISKIFGSNKSDFFLEFDDAKGTQAPEAKQPETVTAPPQPPAEAPQPAASEPPKPAKAKKVKAKKTEKTEQTAAPASQPQPVVPVNTIQPTQQPKAPVVSISFASEYLMPKPTASRRRPGPSMTMFKDMARQMGRR